MRKVITAGATVGILLAGCTATGELTHHGTVGDLATALGCDTADLSGSSGWCTIDGKGHLIGITDDPANYADSYLKNAPSETVAIGDNWYLVCGLMDTGECEDLADPAGGQVVASQSV